MTNRIKVGDYVGTDSRFGHFEGFVVSVGSGQLVGIVTIGIGGNKGVSAFEYEVYELEKPGARS